MKRTVIWSVAAVAVAVAGAAAVVVLWPTPPDPGPIRAAVDAANYCTVNEDCKVTSADCPFSTQLVNAKELMKLNKLYNEYFSAGGRRCMSHEVETRDFTRISCEGGKCVAASLALRGNAARP